MTHEIDAIGLICPLPVLKLRKVLKSLPAGDRVSILADDPVAVIDIPHYCQTNGHKHVETQDMDHGVKRFTIIVGG